MLWLHILAKKLRFQQYFQSVTANMHDFSGGRSVMTVKDLLGHKSLNMTLRYAHLAPAYKVKALKMLDLQLNNKVYFTLHNRGLSHEKKHLTMKLSA
jgi:hypothetical protein